MPDGDFYNWGTRLSDVNGDGLVDLLKFYYNEPQMIYLAKGPYPDLLESVSNGIGGSVQISYSPHKGANNTEQQDKSKLPFPVYTVNSISSSDGGGNTYTTNYEYDKGEFSFAEKEFRGFGKVKVIDADGNYSLNYFHQDEYFKGRSYKQESYDVSGNLYTKIEKTWSAQDNVYSGYPDIKFVYTSESNNYLYDGDASGKRTKVEYVYGESPQYGNPTRIIEYGEVDVSTGGDFGADDRMTETQYTYNTSSWILSLPKAIQAYDTHSALISQKRFYYDNHSSIDDTPTKGLLTKEEIWCYHPVNLTEDWISTQYSYNIYGNLNTTTDANNHAASTTYDSTYHIFPVAAQNHLGHTVTTKYYGVAGEPVDDGLFGQVKSTADPNSQAATNIYDTLGRLIQVIGPNDSAAYPGVIYEFDLTNPVKITKKVNQNFQVSDYLISYSFYDGLGRQIQGKSPAENDPDTGLPRQIVSGIVTYNNSGLVDKKYYPYFTDESASLDTTSMSGQPYVSFVYDSMGRVTQNINADGSYSSMSYDDWTATQVNENGQKVTQYTDAYGRLIKVEEYEGADGRSLEYPYQSYSLYATTNYEYDTQGNLIGITDAKNNNTQIQYDSLGRKIWMSDPDMGIWTYEYDDVGNLVKQTDAKNYELNFTYDELNRLTSKTGTEGPNVIYEYDSLSKNYCIGRLSKVNYEAGSTEFFYDNLGREIKSTKAVDTSAYIVERTYDALDRLKTLKYPDTELITYTYNPQGIETVIGNETYVSNINYSSSGQIIKMEHGNGAVTNYTYDPNTLRLTNLQTTNNQSQTLQDLSYGFDSAGNILAINDYINTGTQSFQYDALSRLTYANGLSYGAKNYSYDEIGNILIKGEMELNYNDTRPHAVSSVVYQDQTINFSYDENGNMQDRNNADTGEATNYYYDQESHLTRVERVYSSGQTVNVTFEFEPGWNFFSLPVVPEDERIEVIFNDLEFNLDYDQISRYVPETDSFQHYVSDVVYNDFNTLEYGTGYQIYITNPGGCSVSVAGTTPQPLSLSLQEGWNLVPYPYLSKRSTEDALGNLQLGVDYDLVLSYNQSTGDFDTYPGSLSELDPTKSYYLHCLRDTNWNLEPLSRITQFYYDGDGGRVKRQSEIDNGQTTIYIGSLFETLIPDAGSTTTKKHIFAGANRVCTVNSDSPSLTYYHGDHLGSSNIITDEDGAQVSLSEYSPFGEISNESGTYSTDIKYTGKIQDDTSLYYYGARYYDPFIGRFITPDSIVQAPQDSQSLNRYAYCRNNPVKYIDPTGHGFFKKFWKTIVGAFVGAVVGVLTFGAGASLAMAGFYGGASGGALSGGLQGDWKGMLIGAAMGGALGAFGGWGVGEFGKGFKGFGYGMLAAGAGVSYGTGGREGLKRFGAGLFGGLVGGTIGNAIDSHWHDGISNKNATTGNMANKGPSENKDWRMLGIGTTGTKAQADANLNQSVSFYTRSRGIASDFIRAGIQKVFGNSLASRQFTGYLRGAEGVSIYTHSEGTLTLTGAAKVLSVDGAKIKNLEINFKGPVIARSTAANVASSIGAKHTYQLNPADPIGVFTTVNPVQQTIYGVLGVVTGAHFHSTPTYPSE